MINPSKPAMPKMWLTSHANMVGIFFQLLIVFIVLVVVYVPIGPPSQIVGVVNRSTSMPGRTGYYQLAYIWVEGREVVLRLPSPNQCHINSSVNLTKQQYMFRLAYSPDWPPCGMQ
jgi:hypothetical protein